MSVQIRELDAPNPQTVVVTVPDPDLMCGHVWERHLRTVVVPEHFARPFTGDVAVVMTLAESPQRCSSEFPTCGLV